MTTSTNYYDELTLDAEMSIEEIESKLAQLETVWNQRLLNEPEKANRILALINEARICFATPEAKAQYDKSLHDTLSDDTEAIDDRHVNFEKWYGQAVEYFNAEQYDLAKTAIEKAALFYDVLDENAEYLSYAADIYRYNKENETALKYINEAIIIDPQGWLPVAIKGAIYNSLEQYSDAQAFFQKANEIANASGDQDRESQSQAFLADTLLYGLKDYVAAEVAANRAVELGDATGLGAKIISELEQPSQVTLDELKNYDREESPYENAIMDLIHQIIGSGLTPESDFGWLMAQKSYFGEYNPNKDGFDEENTTKFEYYLNPEGDFVRKRTLEKEFFKNGQLPFKDIQESCDVCSVLDVMKELDFEGYITYDSGSSWHEHGTSIEYIGYQGPAAIRSNGMLDIKRKTRKKGQELYKKLKSIVDSAAAYIEECNRINSAYYSELEPQKQKINSEYATKISVLQQERDNAIDNAEKSKPQRIALQDQINSLKNELSSLGLFSGKKKKEIQLKIDELEHSLEMLPATDEVVLLYNNRIEELNQQEKDDISKLEKDLREKYPLPSQS